MITFLKKRIINIPNILFLVLVSLFFLPSKYAVEVRTGLKSPREFIIVVAFIEVIFLIKVGNEKKSQAVKDIVSFVYVVLIIWEFFITRRNVLPYVFVPAPENVFHVFAVDYKEIFEGFKSSMYLLGWGLVLAIIASTILGTLVGWIPRLVNAVYPITKAIATVPPLIYIPYVVLIMPTFRSASLFIIFLSVFWGSFMGSMNNTAFVEKKIINSARVLNLSTFSILFKIIIPFNMPRIINSLPIQIATALMTLTSAEMIGSDSGMGFYVRRSLSFADYDKAIAGIIFIGVVVTGLNFIVNLLKKKFVNWEY